MLSAIAIALVLGVLIFFHEFGHFIVAKAFGMGVSTFSLGFGPKLLGVDFNGTNYRLSLIPLGGYVHLVGENPEEDTPEGYSDRENFSLRPSWQKMLVVAAGPIFNFVLAWAIYFGLFWAMGQQALLPQIGKVQEKTPAYEVGLKAGDMVLSINGQKVDYWGDLTDLVQKSPDKELAIQIQRGKKTLSFQVEPEITKTKNIFGEEIKVPRIGIVADKETVRISLAPLESALAGVEQTWRLVSLTWTGLIKLVERVVPLETIGGPIMIAQLVSEQAQHGLADVLALTALISINLGLLNLLPIPILDGGHIVFFALETIIRRPLDPKWKMLAMRVGLSILLAIMALAVYNDIYRILNTQQ